MPFIKCQNVQVGKKFILRLVTLFMFGVSHIEIIVQIALSLQAVIYNLHNHFCMAELLPQNNFFNKSESTLVFNGLFDVSCVINKLSPRYIPFRSYISNLYNILSILLFSFTMLSSYDSFILFHALHILVRCHTLFSPLLRRSTHVSYTYLIIIIYYNCLTFWC